MIILPLALAPSSLYKWNFAALQTKYLYLYWIVSITKRIIFYLHLKDCIWTNTRYKRTKKTTGKLSILNENSAQRNEFTNLINYFTWTIINCINLCLYKLLPYLICVVLLKYSIIQFTKKTQTKSFSSIRYFFNIIK